MSRAAGWIFVAGCLALAPPVHAQSSLPPRWSDLPKLAANWPPAWAVVVSEDVLSKADFEKDVIQRVGTLLGAEAPSKENFRIAEIILAATLRHHQSLHRPAPLADSPANPVAVELEDRLASVRKDWLAHLRKSGDDTEALRLAAQWLPAVSSNHPLRSALQSLWIDQAKAALKKADFIAARTWLDQFDLHFEDAPATAEIRKALREHAKTLSKDAPAKTLVVAVRSLPEYLSPATASTHAEKQSLGLLFDRLYSLEPPSRYRPQLAASLPTGAMKASMALRRDSYFSSGERLTAADLRHTALLMNQPEMRGRSALWRDFLEVPRLEGSPFHLNISYQKALFDPLAPLAFWVLPRFYGGKELQHADDLAFAKAPVGSGPYEFIGRKQEAGKTFALFQTNPFDVRQESNPVREIRMATWTDPRKDLAKPLPHLILDAPTDQLATLKEFGYIENKLTASACVYFLAVNHRKPSLASVSVRRAIAHVLDRQGLLNRHFRTQALAGKYHRAANGLFPRESWANAPAPDVPDDLLNADQARFFARQAKKESATLAWSLKYPVGDPRVKSACEEMAKAIFALFQEAEIKVEVQAMGLPPHVLRKAIVERDYDLLYCCEEHLDDPVRLALFFDRQEDAIRAGGSNYLGYDDLKLHALLQAVLQHRPFTTVRNNMQAIHGHLYGTMPLIPLWQLDTHVLIHPSLRVPVLDPHAVFAKVREWKIE